MNIYKQTIQLGVQPIPPFARLATLVQLPQVWPEVSPFAIANSNLNVAALAFFPRGRMLAGNQASAMLSLSYWSDAQQTGVACIFGQTQIAVPQGAEYFAVAWLQPPAAAFESGPFPEDLFRVVWGLGL